MQGICFPSQRALLSSEGFFLFPVNFLVLLFHSPLLNNLWPFPDPTADALRTAVASGWGMTPLLSFYYNHKNNVPLPSHLFHQCPLKLGFPAVQKHLSYLHMKVWRSCKWIIRQLSWVLVLWASPFCPCCPSGFHWCSSGQTRGKLGAPAGITNRSDAGYGPEISVGGSSFSTIAGVRRCVLSDPWSVWSLLNHLLARFVALPAVPLLGDRAVSCSCGWAGLLPVFCCHLVTSLHWNRGFVQAEPTFAFRTAFSSVFWQLKLVMEMTL